MRPSPSALSRQRGFTILEIAITVSLVSLSLATIGGVFKRSSELANDSRAQLRVHEEHRRNLEAIANVLRAADLDTLTGFTGGVATNPHFECVTGAGQTLTTSGVEELKWEVTTPSDGVTNAGKVVRIVGGVKTTVADRVPQNGFQVRQEGGNLVIRLTTFYMTSQGRTVFLTGETAVFLRN
jgi:type II secretory pathway pseudopilin PulG